MENEEESEIGSSEEEESGEEESEEEDDDGEEEEEGGQEEEGLIEVTQTTVSHSVTKTKKEGRGRTVITAEVRKNIHVL